MAYRATTGLTGKGLVKDQFLGERVFAVCTGPSALLLDWSLLENEYLWGCGLSIDMKEPDHFDFYSVTEQARLPIVEPKIRHLDIPKFYNRHWEAADLHTRYKFPNDDPPPDWKETEARHVGVPTISQFGFSKNLDYVCHIPEASAISGVLQPALWLGFKEIYVIGMDLSGHYSHDAPGRIGTRNVHAIKYIADPLNQMSDELEKNFPDVKFANLGDKNANPALHLKFPLKMEYMTLEESLA